MKKATAIVLLMITGPIAAWLGSEIYHAKKRYPEGVENYLNYIETMPEPRAVKKMKKEGNEFYIFFGPVAPLALVSGPPAYIFDEKGEMVDWSGDIGEDSRFSKSWKSIPDEEFTIEDVDLILRVNWIEQAR